MDLSTIQLHLDNFVTTWKGWTDVLQGIAEFFKSIADFGAERADLEAEPETEGAFEGLSSLSSDAGPETEDSDPTEGGE